MPPEPPSWGNLFTPHLDAWSVLPVVSLLGLLAYGVGLIRLRRAGITWPWWPTAAWADGGRMLLLILPMPFHAFFGVAIMMSSSLVVASFADPPRSWGVDPLADQNTAGSIAWSFGELPTVLLLAVVFFSWARSEERRGRTLDRAAQRTADAELEAYNARLRALARSDG